MSSKEITAITASTEINALIETLHGAEQRLAELTAGEVDAVVSQQGRTMLLRLAQIQLRESEAVKQAAILDALPAHVALLDGQGRIVSVNLQWRRSSGTNAIAGLGCGVGSSYPEACDGTPGIEPSEARRIAAGVRSVLEGHLKIFSIEYPCGRDTEQRWYILTVTPLADDQASGAVVMHVDVTAERRTEQDLRVSESRFRQMAQSVDDVFFLRAGPNGVFIAVKSEEARPLGGEAAINFARQALRTDLLKSETGMASVAANLEAKYEGDYINLMGQQGQDPNAQK